MIIITKNRNKKKQLELSTIFSHIRSRSFELNFLYYIWMREFVCKSTDFDLNLIKSLPIIIATIKAREFFVFVFIFILNISLRRDLLYFSCIISLYAFSSFIKNEYNIICIFIEIQTHISMWILLHVNSNEYNFQD
jgi:hypothetical protein